MASGEQQRQAAGGGETAGDRMQAGQGGERGEAAAAERERADLRDRDGVAMDGQVIGGRDGRGAEHERARRQRDRRRQ